MEQIATEEDLDKLIQNGIERIRKNRNNPSFPLLSYEIYMYGLLLIKKEFDPTFDIESIDNYSNVGFYSSMVEHYNNNFESTDIDMFIENKAFNLDYLSKPYDLLIEANESLSMDESFLDVLSYKTLTEEEFYTYLYEFLEYGGLTETFSRCLQNKRLFLNPRLCNAFGQGLTLFDPITEKIIIYENSFRYSLLDLMIIAHELGHAKDFEMFEEKSNDEISRYFSKSPKSEILSIAYEKLLVDFLLEKGDYPLDIKRLFKQSIVNGLDNVSMTYKFSCLDDCMLRDGLESFSNSQLINCLKKKFMFPRLFISDLRDNVYNAYDMSKYAYGEVIGTLLKERIRDEGISSSFVRKVLDNRLEEFSSKFIYDNFSVNDYQKVLRRRVEQVKSI